MCLLELWIPVSSRSVPLSLMKNCERSRQKVKYVGQGRDASDHWKKCPFVLAVPCLAGEFSRTGLTPCYPCPRDYYQPDPGKSYCLSCPFYGTTTVIGARSITDCSSKPNCLCWSKWIKGTSAVWPAADFIALLTNVNLPLQPVMLTAGFAHWCFLSVM